MFGNNEVWKWNKRYESLWKGKLFLQRWKVIYDPWDADKQQISKQDEISSIIPEFISPFATASKQWSKFVWVKHFHLSHPPKKSIDIQFPPLSHWQITRKDLSSKHRHRFNLIVIILRNSSRTAYSVMLCENNLGKQEEKLQPSLVNNIWLWRRF